MKISEIIFIHNLSFFSSLFSRTPHFLFLTFQRFHSFCPVVHYLIAFRGSLLFQLNIIPEHGDHVWLVRLLYTPFQSIAASEREALVWSLLKLPQVHALLYWAF